ncbi:MAG TPA: 50S ribosomal protein L13 [Candidatus Paceibacterota bacterium]|nr:50S ribosomal protein L13 [Candidatus Paceibacterota bacterium]
MDYHIDADKKILGRLATEIAAVLQGKKSAKYEPRLVGSDKVYLTNYKKVKVSGAKGRDKVYYRHTGYVGHVKEKTFDEAMTKDPKWVVRNAVRHMLPKNALNQKRMKNLIFVDSK